MSLDVHNFGCRLNLAEGEAIARDWTGGDAVLINSCAVTAEAARQARQAARRAKRTGALVLATGCAVRVDESGWSKIAEILPARRDPRPAVSGDRHARAFVEVQNGCDHECTFCITRIARGPSRSLAPEAIVRAIRAAVEAGRQEAILTGVDLTSYDGGLAPLVARILHDVPELGRLRLSSLDPMAVDDALIGLFASEPRLMPHVHLSIQSGDDLILKRMKRRHLRTDAIGLVQRLRAARPEIVIGADLIAGFPTESEAMFENTYVILDACDIVFAHIFPYSPRPGTAASRMPLVQPAIARARAAQLRAAAAARKAAWLDGLIGTPQNVLIERDGKGGHAENFARVDVTGAPGSIVRARITANNGDRLTGLAA